MKKGFFLLLGDIVLVILSFLLLTWIKSDFRLVISADDYIPFLFFVMFWTITSLIAKKYYFSNFFSIKKTAKIILTSNISALAVIGIFLLIVQEFSYSRIRTFGTVLSATTLELLGALIFNSILKSAVIDENNNNGKKDSINGSVRKSKSYNNRIERVFNNQNSETIAIELLKIIENDHGKDVRKLIEKYAQESLGRVQIISTSTRFNIYSLPDNGYGCIINLMRTNDIQYINKFFEAVNSKIPIGGLFIGKAETYNLRKKRILKKYFFPLNYIFYVIDFVFKRIFPKVPILKQIYFFVTRGRNRLLSRAETLGRLYSCGFEIIEEQFINNDLFFIVRKADNPKFPVSPTYGPLIRLNRIGKGGVYFKVYKMRTMHPFAEYLQPYIYDKYDLQDGGKFKDDFRVSTLGKIMRKVWIDELPMLINIIRGEMKIVGVRPLSSHYYNLYSKDLQEKRIRHKPGLIPPFYADMPKTLDEIMASEMQYLTEYEKKPLKTDLKYFVAAWQNIIFKKARSN